MLSVNQKVRLVIHAVGIFISFTIYGVLQEIIFRGRYGAEHDHSGEKFTFSVAFVAIQCIVSSLFAKGVTRFQDHPNNEKNEKFYFWIALFNVSATVTSIMALQWIPYPTQVIAKASKPIPVMILAVLIGRKTFAFQKYVFVFMIVFGVGLFVKEKCEFKDGEDFSRGGYLIAISLLMDGLTGAVQDRMRSESKPTAINFMLHSNVWSSMILLVLMSITGEGRDVIEFAKKYPSVIWHLTLATFVGTVGNFFVSAMISSFGSLPLALVTTTRKFFTVLFSALTFGHKLSLQQWFAASLIFSALMLDAFFSKKYSVEPQEPKTSLSLAGNVSVISDEKPSEKLETSFDNREEYV